MYLLIEIRDSTSPQMICKTTPVDLFPFHRLEDAIIYAEPHYMDEREEGSGVIVSEEGEFGIIPIAKSRDLPEIVEKWRDPELAKFYFDCYGQQKR